MCLAISVSSDREAPLSLPLNFEHNEGDLLATARRCRHRSLLRMLRQTLEQASPAGETHYTTTANVLDMNTRAELSRVAHEWRPCDNVAGVGSEMLIAVLETCSYSQFGIVPHKTHDYVIHSDCKSPI